MRHLLARRRALAGLLALAALLPGSAPPARAEGGAAEDDIKTELRLEREIRSSDPQRRIRALEELGRKVRGFGAKAKEYASRTLRVALKDRDPKVRTAAVLAAGGEFASLPGDLLPSLFEAMLDPDPAAKPGSRYPYGAVEGGQEGRDRAMRIVQEGPDLLRPVAAAWFVYTDGWAGRKEDYAPDPILVQAHLQGLSHADVRVRRLVLDSASRCGPLARGLAGSLPPALTDPDPEVRLAALRVAVLAGRDAEGSWGPVVHLVESGSPEERAAALWALRGMDRAPGPEDIPVLARVLLQGENAAPLLARAAPEARSAAVAALRQALGAPGSPPRLEVVLALAGMGELPPLPRVVDPSLDSVLAALLDLRATDSAGADGLLALLGPRVLERLKWLLKGPTIPRTEEAWKVLLAAGKQAAAVLRDLLGAEDSATRRRSAMALSAMGPVDEETRRALLGGCLDTDPRIAAACREGLEAGGGGPAPPAEAIPPLVCWPGYRERFPGSQARPDGGGEWRVEPALAWLAAHQSADGHWDSDGFGGRCPGDRCGGPGDPRCDPGATGLALLAFLGHGETQAVPERGEVVARGLRWLADIQDAEGCFGPRTWPKFTFNHAIATLAMAEACGMTGAPSLRGRAQSGINFISRCRNPYLAWRYGVKPQDNDTAVTGWMVAAAAAGQRGGLDVDPEDFDGAMNWVEKVTEPEYGRAGYTARGNGPWRPKEKAAAFPADKSEGTTAIAVALRIDCGAARDDEYLKKGVGLCLKSLPLWDEQAGSIDFHYWMWGSQAMAAVGGYEWKRWKEALVTALEYGQHMDKSQHRYGSWDPVDPYGAEGGRIAATALNALALESWYRVPRAWEGK